MLCIYFCDAKRFLFRKNRYLAPCLFYFLKKSSTQVEIFSWLSIIHFRKNHMNMEEAKRWDEMAEELLLEWQTPVCCVLHILMNWYKDWVLIKQKLQRKSLHSLLRSQGDWKPLALKETGEHYYLWNIENARKYFTARKTLIHICDFKSELSVQRR